MRQVYSLLLRKYLAYKRLRIWFFLRHYYFFCRESNYKNKKKLLEFKGLCYLQGQIISKEVHHVV